MNRVAIPQPGVTRWLHFHRDNNIASNGLPLHAIHICLSEEISEWLSDQGFEATLECMDDVPSIYKRWFVEFSTPEAAVAFKLRWIDG